MGGLVNGDLDDAEVKQAALDRAREAGYIEADE
jgi:urease subunit beta